MCDEYEQAIPEGTLIFLPTCFQLGFSSLAGSVLAVIQSQPLHAISVV